MPHARTAHAAAAPQEENADREPEGATRPTGALAVRTKWSQSSRKAPPPRTMLGGLQVQPST
eukprot:7384025-Prymnesium_polylepis.1